MSEIKIYKDLQQGTPAWHEARRGIITASEIGKMVTKAGKFADNDSSRGLIAEKAAQRITGHIDETPTTFAMQRGHDDEAEARDIYSERVHPVDEVGFVVRRFYDFRLGYSPDGLVGNDGLIEVKSRKQKFQMQDASKATLPDDFKAQVQAGMMISGRPWCDFISFPACGGGMMMVLRVDADVEYQDRLLEVAIKAEAGIAKTLEMFRDAQASGKARFFNTERREYSDPTEVEFF